MFFEMPIYIYMYVCMYVCMFGQVSKNFTIWWIFILFLYEVSILHIAH